MRGAGEREISSISAPGKAFLIAVVLVFSSLSFTLGYFVGRNVPGRKADPAAVVSYAVPEAGNGAAPAATPPPASEEPRNTEQPAATPHGNGQHSPLQPQPDGASNVPAGSKDAGAAQPAATPPAAQHTKETEHKAEIQGSGTEKALYSVQLGALKNRQQAEKLRKKYEKKGYKTYLIVSRNKKHEKIYKIRVGEFDNRNDAETLSENIRKAEGLKSFVTFKNDQER